MNLRQIRDHELNGLNEAISLFAVGEPGSGGANIEYKIVLATKQGREVTINYQEGPIQDVQEHGNGFTTEVMVAIQIDRMRGFQYGRNPDGTFNFDIPGRFACLENAEALKHLESALFWLQKRTKDRLARGVEGKLEK